MSNSRKINFVICGAFGYMGSSGMNGLRELVPILEERGVVANLLALVDVGLSPAESDDGDNESSDKIALDTAKKIQSIRNFCIEHFSVAPVFCTELSEFGNVVQMVKRDEDVNNPIVVYDATPVNVHWEIMTYVEKLRREGVNIRYLGEKPLFTDPQQIVAAESYLKNGSEFFCDFIETKNLTTLAIKSFLESNPDFLPEEMWFWRAGSSAIKKFINADRPGVAGGAHMDKMPHDLSITVSILGAENIESWEILNPTFDYACLGGHISEEKCDMILSSSNSWVADLEFDLEQRHRLPADAFSSFDVEWSLKDGRKVLAHYASSWIGVMSALSREIATPAAEVAIVEKLEACGFIHDEWLNTKTEKGPIVEWGAPPKYKGQVGDDWSHYFEENQARIAILRFGSRHLFANFYHNDRRKGASDTSNLAGRWLYLYDSETQKRKNISIYEDVSQEKMKDYADMKGNDFTRLLTSVTDSIFDGDGATDISSRAAIIVHKVLLQAYDQIVSEFERQKDCTTRSVIEKVRPVYEEKIRAKGD